MSLLTIIIDLLKWFLAGVVLFLAVPIATRPLEWRQKQPIIELYHGMAMSALGRGIMLIRSNGGQELKQTSFDASNGGERTTISGETKHWTNPGNMMLTFEGRPFALAHEDKDVLFDIRTAHIGELFRDYKERGIWELNGYRKAYANIAEAHPVVDVRPVVDSMQANVSPGLADRIDEFVEKMQSLFDSNRMFEYLPWLIGLGAGVGLMFMISKAMETTGGTVVS